MGPFEILRCTPEDAARLTEVAHASKRHWGYPEHYIEEWRPSLTVTPEMIEAHQVEALRIDGQVAGFYVLIRSGARMELEHFWVDPPWIGRGLGRELFVHAVESARDLGAEFLDILSDPNAEGFYRRMGAVRIGDVAAPVDNTERYLPRLTLALGRRTRGR